MRIFVLLFFLLLTSCATHSLNERKIYFGTAVKAKYLESDSKYKKQIEKNFNLITPEYEFKFAETQPVENQFNFKRGDQLVSFAQSQGWSVRGTCFLWHKSIPNWIIEKQSTQSADLKKVLKNHITTEMNHFSLAFPNVVKYWDVANELVDDVGNLRTNHVWSQISKGSSQYIHLAFQYAHEADPKAILFYNDYGIEEINIKSDAVYNLIRDLKNSGAPIHGIGFQGHFNSETEYDFDSIKKNFKRFSDLGLVIHITEADYRINMNSSKIPMEMQIKSQVEFYKNLAQVCVENLNCQAFVVWGLSDKYSWIPEVFDGWGSAHLFDNDLNEKSSLNELHTLLKFRN